MKTELLVVLFAILIYLKHIEFITTEYSTIAIIMVVALILTFENNNEHMTDLEALGILGNMYNTGNATLTNLTVTGNLTVNGDAQVANNLNCGNTISGKSGTYSGLLKTTGDIAVDGKMTVGGTGNYINGTTRIGNNLSCDNIFSSRYAKINEWCIVNDHKVVTLNTPFRIKTNGDGAEPTKIGHRVLTYAGSGPDKGWYAQFYRSDDVKKEPTISIVSKDWIADASANTAGTNLE